MTNKSCQGPRLVKHSSVNIKGANIFHLAMSGHNTLHIERNPEGKECAQHMISGSTVNFLVTESPRQFYSSPE